jgi:hypothetical protein
MTLESRCETPLTTLTILCACGHRMAEHDSVAARYCRATASGDLHRDCVCTVASGPMPR